MDCLHPRQDVAPASAICGKQSNVNRKPEQYKTDTTLEDQMKQKIVATCRIL